MGLKDAVVLFSGFCGALAAAQVPADLVVVNARVYALGEAGEAAQALAVHGARITAVGRTEEVRRAVGPKTRVIDAGGRAVVAGFNDAHVHFLQGGFQLSSVDLRDAATPEEFARRIGVFARKLEKGRWVLGGDWDHELWQGGVLPRREWIDGATGETPVFVSRLDGHMEIGRASCRERG